MSLLRNCPHAFLNLHAVQPPMVFCHFCSFMHDSDITHINKQQESNQNTSKVRSQEKVHIDSKFTSVASLT